MAYLGVKSPDLKQQVKWSIVPWRWKKCVIVELLKSNVVISHSEHSIAITNLISS